MELLSGSEKFTLHGKDTGITVLDYWAWSCSDLYDNAMRGVMAEFLVTSSFTRGATHPSQMRTNWLPYDVTSPTGRRIEVKSAAYIQSWTPEDVYSQIKFDIGKKLAWDGISYASKPDRNCDLYVFCVFTALTRDISVLNLDYWDFYVLPTSALNEKAPEQKSIALSSLLKLNPVKTDFEGLGEIIATIKL
ncbi:MAG: hypothetical protein HFH69_00675 [Lachnospiraceae bacterium]|nr:hypothetical protein [Lachnospiraceae bacterium]